MSSSQKPTAQAVIVAIRTLRLVEKCNDTKRAAEIRAALKEAHQ